MIRSYKTSCGTFLYLPAFGIKCKMLKNTKLHLNKTKVYLSVE